MLHPKLTHSHFLGTKRRYTAQETYDLIDQVAVCAEDQLYDRQLMETVVHAVEQHVADPHLQILFPERVLKVASAFASLGCANTSLFNALATDVGYPCSLYLFLCLLIK